MTRAFTILGRGLRRRCPRCGEGKLFRSFYTLNETCASCGLSFDDPEGKSWAFMYLMTGGLTGVFIILLLLITPKSYAWGRVAVGASALALIAGTLPWRKGLVIALTFLIDRATGDGPTSGPS